MSCKITYTNRFAKEMKRLSKHYKSIKQDYANLLESLRENPLQGTDLGKGLRKVRMAIAFLAIYDKSECESLDDKELQRILAQNGLL